MAHIKVTVVAAVLLACSSAHAETAFDTSNPLVVRVYDLGGVDGAVRTQALRTAQTIFAEAGVSSEWHDCTLGARSPARACAEPRRPRDLIVRILRRLDAADAWPRALGVSVVESGRGVLATVFLDLIEPVAQRTGTDLQALLGRAIAHEVGHLMLGTSAHSATGLMRDIWTARELGRNDARDWLFEAEERAVLRASSARAARQPDAAPAAFDAHADDISAR